jgi:TetR/AcrR family transcriptional regulator
MMRKIDPPGVKRARAATKPRSAGRPTSAAANIDQRRALLDTAIALFSERGIAATPLRAIAQQAGVTPALLHYYFQSKDTLVETILAERVAPFVAVSVAPLLNPLPSPRATLRIFLENHMRNLAANLWLPRLMLREVLSDGGSLRAQVQAQFAAVISPKTIMLIAAAQRRGEIRADLDPLLIGISLISLAVFPFAAAPVWHEAALTIFRGAPEAVLKAVKTHPAAAKPGGFGVPSWDALIDHTLAVFDGMLEVPRAKSKR